MNLTIQQQNNQMITRWRVMNKGKNNYIIHLRGNIFLKLDVK